MSWSWNISPWWQRKQLLEPVDKAFPFVLIWVLHYESQGWGCSFFTHSLFPRRCQWSNQLPVAQFIFPGHFPSSDSQSLMKLALLRVIPMYILWIHQSLPYPEHLSGVTDPWAQCHVPVQKLYSWTKIVLAEQMCAHVSKAFWCEHMSLVMKCSPRNTRDVPSPTVDLLLGKGEVPSHCLFTFHLLICRTGPAFIRHC